MRACRDHYVGCEETCDRVLSAKSSCKTCGRSFTGVVSLWRHVWLLRTRATDRHTGHECPWPQCDRVFADRSMRARHEAHHPAAAVHHQAATVFSCELCGVTVWTAAAYDRHVAVWHPREASATCFACRTFHSDRAGLACHVALKHGRPLPVHPLCGLVRARPVVEGQAGPPGDRQNMAGCSWRLHSAKELEAANRLLTLAGGPGPRAAMTIIPSRPPHVRPNARTARFVRWLPLVTETRPMHV